MIGQTHFFYNIIMQAIIVLQVTKQWPFKNMGAMCVEFKSYLEFPASLLQYSA